MENNKNLSKKNQLMGILIKFFKKPLNIFIFFLFVSAFTGFGLFLLDSVNYLRPDSLKIDALINIFKTNINALTWVICAFAFIFIFISLLTWVLYNPIIEYAKKKHATKEKNKKYLIIFFLAIVVLLGLLIFILIWFFPWNKVKDITESESVDGKNIALSFAMIIVLMLVASLIFIILLYLIKAIAHLMSKTIKNRKPAVPVLDKKRRTKKSIIKFSFKKHRGRTIFPSLIAIDDRCENIIDNKDEQINTTIDLKKFANQFQAYLAKHEYYFEINIVRAFIAGMNASRLIILEGLSGTGKTTLPRMFNDFIGGKTHFYPVQSTWRDRTDVVGYYSDFTKQFKETEFLKDLYTANYARKSLNLMVLDEMNISRVEYYFADFLSILEYPKEDWLVPLINDSSRMALPKMLVDGKIRIPENTWFIGTLNIDDSTFTVSDKVYDRAIPIDFRELAMPITCECSSDPWPLSATELIGAFQNAMKIEQNKLTIREKEKFAKLCAYTTDIFDIQFGNRILNQLYNFLPVYVALGGSKEEAIDFIFARKIIRKVDGKYESYVSVGLNKLLKYIQTLYGKNKFKETELYINKLRKKFM